MQAPLIDDDGWELIPKFENNRPIKVVNEDVTTSPPPVSPPRNTVEWVTPSGSWSEMS